MRPYRPFLIGAVLLCIDLAARAQQGSNYAPVIATSGDVEIASIRIRREAVSEAGKGADLTNMRIELWLTEKYKKGTQALFLVKLDELGPIEDDTGKLLTTKKRLEWIKHLKWEVSETNMRITRNKMGPTMGFTIDAPARQATKIKSLKGKATVAEYTSVQIEIDNKTAFSGKVLDHPKLKGLAIKPTIAFEDGSTSVNLNMPNESGRLDEWGLIEKGKYASLESIAGNERTFRGDHRNAASVWFIIRDPSNTKTLTFDFKDIELP